MPSPKHQEALDLYIALLEEAKLRFIAIDYAVKGLTDLPKPFAREFCFLQLRLICEVIGLACLTAHGDIRETASKKFRQAYSPNDILKWLEKLHPRFYPLPVVTHKEGHMVKMRDDHCDFLTRQDLISLHGQTGNVLHRSNIEDIKSGKPQFSEDFEEVIKWSTKISNLLAEHSIVMLDDTGIIYCVWSAADKDGQCVAMFASAM